METTAAKMYEVIMQLISTHLNGLSLIQLKIFSDSRGFFVERFRAQELANLGIKTQFIQDNHSHSKPNVLRGLHLQLNPGQAKLVGVIRGKIWDVAVDVRPSSSTLGQYFTVELSDENGRLLYVPPGFAHGFCVLGDQAADVLYKVDSYYQPSNEVGLMWNDPDLKIPWPNPSPIVSDRDQMGLLFKDYLKQHCK